MNVSEQGEGVRKGSFYMFLALSFTGASLFLFQILAARKIGKAEFGKLGVFYSLFSFTASFLASGFRDFVTVNLPGISTREELKNFLKRVFTSFIFYILLFYLLIWILSPIFLYRFFDKNILTFSLFSLCFISLFSLMFIRGILFGFRKMSYVAISHSIYGLFLFLTGIFFYLFKSNIFHFELSYLISLIIPFPVTLYLLRRLSPLYFGFNFRNIIPFKNPVLMSTINSILETYFYIGILLMKIKDTPYSQIGLFNAILTFFMGIKTLYTAIFMPLLPNLSYAISRRDKKLFKHYIKRVITLIILTLLILLILSATFLPSLWNLLFGKEFQFYKIDFIFISFIVSLYLTLRLLSRAFFAIKEINYIFLSFLLFLFLLSLLFFFLPFNPLLSMEISFIASSAIILLLLYLKIVKILSGS